MIVLWRFCHSFVLRSIYHMCSRCDVVPDTLAGKEKRDPVCWHGLIKRTKIDMPNVLFQLLLLQLLIKGCTAKTK